jgi:hypothetical protein
VVIEDDTNLGTYDWEAGNLLSKRCGVKGSMQEINNCMNARDQVSIVRECAGLL